MAIKVGINGFGRIGRLAFRAMVNDPEIEVVAVNDLGDIPTMAHLLKYDSIHGRAFDTVEVTEDGFVADGHAVKVLSEREPANLPWGELGVDVVVESTGFFTDGTKAKAHRRGRQEGRHLRAGQERGHHHRHGRQRRPVQQGRAQHHLERFLHDELPGPREGACGQLRIKRGYEHDPPCTNDQKIPRPSSNSDLRRARAAAMSMIPTTTGAARAVSLVLPELKGSSTASPPGAPTPDGLMVDPTAELQG